MASRTLRATMWSSVMNGAVEHTASGADAKCSAAAVWSARRGAAIAVDAARLKAAYSRIEFLEKEVLAQVALSRRCVCGSAKPSPLARRGKSGTTRKVSSALSATAVPFTPMGTFDPFFIPWSAAAGAEDASAEIFDRCLSFLQPGGAGGPSVAADKVPHAATVRDDLAAVPGAGAAAGGGRDPVVAETSSCAEPEAECVARDARAAVAAMVDGRHDAEEARQEVESENVKMPFEKKVVAQPRGAKVHSDAEGAHADDAHVDGVLVKGAHVVDVGANMCRRSRSVPARVAVGVVPERLAWALQITKGLLKHAGIRPPCHIFVVCLSLSGWRAPRPR